MYSVWILQANFMHLQSFLRSWRDPLGIRQCRTGSTDLSLDSRYLNDMDSLWYPAVLCMGYLKSSEGQGALKQPWCSPDPGLTRGYFSHSESQFSIIRSDGRLGSDAPLHLRHSHLLPYSLPTNYIYSGSTISFFPCVFRTVFWFIKALWVWHIRG